MTAAAGIDRAVLDWFVAHREPWLDAVAQVVTVLGSSVLLIPLVFAAGIRYRRRHGTFRPLALLAVTYGGAYLLSQAIKVLAGRPRPPAGVAIGHHTGYAFPSGHATQAAAVYLMLAAVLAAGTPRRRHTAWLWSAAVLTVVLVGITRLYLAAHWLTDVIGGFALGALLFVFVLAASHRYPAGRAAPGP